MDHTIFVLRQRMVTGAFIVLTGENGKEHPGVYIRDLDPLFNPADNSDLSMEIGPSAVARKLTFPWGWDGRLGSPYLRRTILPPFTISLFGGSGKLEQ